MLRGSVYRVVKRICNLCYCLQVFPSNLLSPTYVDSHGRVNARTEVERRESFIQHLYDQVGRAHPLVNLVKTCLHNDPDKRPHALGVLGQLTTVQSTFSDPYMQLTKLEMMQRLKESEGQIQKMESDRIEIEREIQDLRVGSIVDTVYMSVYSIQ